jgi:pimeloyl-ACP methyl ester carboxylesterase
MALYAFDGTWNSATLNDDVEQEDETNVANFFEAYREKKWYVSGPGTRHGKVGRAVGGGAGAGSFERVAEAYDELCKNFAAGDKAVDIVGFSRGAALALDFANKIQDAGIRRVGSRDVVENNPRIRFLGLWDVVGSFGVPIGKIFQKVNLGHKLYLAKDVDFCFHAMAMDERRQTFRVTRLLNAYEVWFRGVHSDVGGGNGNVALSSIALRWMLLKAKAAGLPIEPSAIGARDGRIDANAPLRPPTDAVPNEYRGFLKDDRFHYTVAERPGHNNAPQNCRRESKEDEGRAARLSELPKREVGQSIQNEAIVDASRYPASGD